MKPTISQLILATGMLIFACATLPRADAGSCRSYLRGTAGSMATGQFSGVFGTTRSSLAVSGLKLERLAG